MMVLKRGKLKNPNFGLEILKLGYVQVTMTRCDRCMCIGPDQTFQHG